MSTIRVRFGKNGFYHPALGRMGRGDVNRGKIYILPEHFAETEEVEVPVKDPRTKEVVELRKYTRYKHLPRSAEIIDDDRMAEMIEEAEANNEKPPQTYRPKVVAAHHMPKVTGRGHVPRPQTGTERTTGRSTRRTSRRSTSD